MDTPIRCVDIAVLERETQLRREAEAHNIRLRAALGEKPYPDEWAAVCDALENLVNHVHDEECAEAGCRYVREAGALITAIRAAEQRKPR